MAAAASIMATITTAAAHVFAVPELLENILINLSPVELYQAQRVDQTFQATISGSPKLQAKMHLECLDDRNKMRLVLCTNAVFPFSVGPKPNFHVKHLQRHFPKEMIEPGNVINILIEYDDVSDPDAANFPTKLSRQPDTASWRKIKMGTPGQKIYVTLDYWARSILLSRHLVENGERTYGDLIDVCIKKFKVLKQQAAVYSWA